MKAIFTFKTEECELEIKLNLINLSEYSAFAATCPDRIKDRIKQSWGCGNCNPRCAGGFTFELDGAAYKKCSSLSFYFKHPRKEELETYKKLPELENRYKG